MDEQSTSKEAEPGVSEFKSRGGLRRIAGAFLYSLEGLKTAVRSEHAFRQELTVAIPAMLVALLLPVSALEKLALIAPLFLVLIVELINSAIEAVVDRISLERHPLSKNAKDFGSAAVLLCVLLATLIWMVIALPVLVRWFAAY